MKFGEKIKILRTLAGMTQKELAVAAGMQQSVVARYESGDVVPYSSPLVRMSEALNQKNNINWLRGNGDYIQHDGLTLYRPMSPYSIYTAATIRSIDNALATLLSSYVDENSIVTKSLYTSQFGAVLVASDANKNKTLAVICRPEIIDALKAAFTNFDETKGIPDIDVLNMLFFLDPGPICRYCDLPDDVAVFVSNNTQKNVEDVSATIQLTAVGINEDLLDDVKECIERIFSEKKVVARIEMSLKPELHCEIDPKIWAKMRKKYKVVGAAVVAV